MQKLENRSWNSGKWKTGKADYYEIVKMQSAAENSNPSIKYYLIQKCAEYLTQI